MSDKFGKYIVESEIGKGGFGRVYRAFDADMQRRIAIKEVISSGDPDLLARFQSEASTTASLIHKNIVTVYEYGQNNGRPYLVMEFLQGRTLQEVISSGNNLPLLEKVEIMYQIAEGLHHAHTHGVIHRDIKPGNIMVLAENKVKIMDFGIARLVNSPSDRRTREGYLIGAIMYMAPEIFLKGDADKRTDIFAYGVVYYEFLTGHHPFQAKDVYAAMNRISNDEPPALSESISGCPYALELLVQRLMMKDREARFDDLSDVLFDTEPILRQLRQERAGVLAKESEALYQRGDLDALLPCVKQILSLDPANSQALFWQDKIRECVNRRRAEKLCQQGREHMAASRFKDAVACFEGALHLEKNKSEMAALLEQARSAVGRVNRSAKLVADARIDRQEGNLEKALAAVSEAVELDPANQEATHLRDSLRRQLRESQAAARLSECQELRLQGRYEEALAVLDALDRSLQQRSDIVAVRTRIQQEIREADHQKRRVRLEAELQSGRKLLREFRLEEATHAAGLICSEFSEEPEAVAFKKEVAAFSGKLGRSEAFFKEGMLEASLELVRELLRDFGPVEELQARERELLKSITQRNYTRELENVLVSGRRQLEAGKTSEAINMLETAAFRYDGEPRIQTLLDTARAAAMQEERNARLQSYTERIRAASQSAEWEAASQTLTKARSEFPRETVFDELEATVSGARVRAEEQQKRQRERAILAGYREVAELSRSGSFTAAYTALDQLVREYGDSPATQALRKELESARQARLQSQEISDIVARSAQELRKNDCRAALRMLEEALKRYPRSAELLQQRQRVLDRLPPEKSGAARDEAIAAGIRKAAMLEREGDFEGAVNALESILKRYPNSSELRRHLQHFRSELERQREAGNLSGSSSWFNRFVNRDKK